MKTFLKGHPGVKELKESEWLAEYSLWFECPKCKHRKYREGNNCVVCLNCGVIVSDEYRSYDSAEKFSERLFKDIKF